MSLASSTDESRRNPIGSLVKKKTSQWLSSALPSCFFLLVYFLLAPIFFSRCKQPIDQLVLSVTRFSVIRFVVDRQPSMDTNKQTFNKQNQPTNKQTKKEAKQSIWLHRIDSTDVIGWRRRRRRSVWRAANRPASWTELHYGVGTSRRVASLICAPCPTRPSKGADGWTHVRPCHAFALARGHSTEFYWVFLQVFWIFCRLRRVFTVFLAAIEAFWRHRTEFYWVYQDLSSGIGFNWVLRPLMALYRVLLGFSDFFVGNDGFSLYWRVLRPSDGIVPSFTGFFKFF